MCNITPKEITKKIKDTQFKKETKKANRYIKMEYEREIKQSKEMEKMKKRHKNRRTTQKKMVTLNPHI